jgi:hypothetical protein
VSSVNEFLTGLHLQHFRHWPLRFLYLFGGLAGCVCIATGFLFFANKRRAQHARDGIGGARLVDALSVATVCGTLVAVLAILVATRLLPAELPGRDGWQELSFWMAWLASGVHAFWRARGATGGLSPAWREQAACIALLAFAAALLNWTLTEDHLFAALARGYWPVAGIDLALLTVSGVAFLAARRLWHPRTVALPVPG